MATTTAPEVKAGTIPIYIMGKRYDVPDTLTIMKALEYAGYQYIRGCGCRGGVCGACATVYRKAGDYKIRTGLACQTVVEPSLSRQWFVKTGPLAEPPGPVLHGKTDQGDAVPALDFLPPVHLCHVPFVHVQDILLQTHRDENFRVFRKVPDAAPVEMVIVVVGDDHPEVRRHFFERFYGDPGSRLSLHHDSSLGEHGVCEPVLPVDADQKGVVADPHNEIALRHSENPFFGILHHTG